MIYLELLLICCIIVFIIDLSGAIHNLIHPIVIHAFKLPKNANMHIPLIECSLCVTFWTGIIFLLVTGNFTIFNFAYVCGLAFFSTNIKGVLLYIQELLNIIEWNLYKLIRK